MKKFLCYDTNDAASGKIGVNSNGVLSPNATVPSTNGTANQYLVTDADGNTKWEDRLAYDTTKTEFVGTQYLINLDPTSGTVMSQDIIPMELGQTYTVKVTRGDGQGTKEYTGLDVVADDDMLYIGSSDVENGDYPFRIAESSTTVAAAFINGAGYNCITVTCISNGKIKTIDPKYIKDMYCDNRTILVEQTRVTNAVEGPIIKPSLLINGTPVSVNIDGTEYDATLEEGGTYMVGTGSAPCYYHIGIHGGIDIRDHITNTSVYPFFVVISEDGTCIVLFDGESAGPTGTEHEFAVYSGSIKQIDPKYIPNTDVFFVTSSGSFKTGTDWDSGEDATIADIVSAYHDGGARIFQMSSGECIGISNVIGASASGSSSPFITYYNYLTKAVYTKS